MSWKMFWQIVLLIVVASVVAAVVKCGAMQCKLRYMKCFKGHHEMSK